MMIPMLACVTLLSYSSSLMSMDGLTTFPFKVFIENKSKSPITLINCWGAHDVCSELDSQVIEPNTTIGIERGQGRSEIFKLVIAGVKNRIINIPDIVWTNFNAPHDPTATKRRCNGYRVKLDNDVRTEEFVPVVLNQAVRLTVGEDNAIRFTAAPDAEKLSIMENDILRLVRLGYVTLPQQ